MSGLPARRRVEERRAAAEVAIPEEDATAEEDAGLEPEGSSAGGGGTGEYDADAWKAFGRRVWVRHLCVPPVYALMGLRTRLSRS